MKNNFNQLNIESNVSGYSKSFPTVFEYSKNDILKDYKNKEYIDFFSGAGALNYGHNNSAIQEELIKFLKSDAPVHCLDMDSVRKLNFLERFDEVILKPRGFNYKVQFPSPSGTNAVEAAIKLARKVTKRSKIISFSNSFHGMTATSLALSASQERKHKDIPPQDVMFFPFDGFLGSDIDTMDYLSKLIKTKGSGFELPAAIILETIQAEGGIKIASKEWLVKLEKFTRNNGILLIVDDIQVGCGRTGNFFSFERAGITPDIVLLSKSISGFGIPLSLVLLKPELDIWLPGEHNGTFRANNLALCAATKALDYWVDNSFTMEIAEKSNIIKRTLNNYLYNTSSIVSIRGIGLIWGIELLSGEVARNISKMLFEEGMIVETCGDNGQVIKLLPPLTITNENLKSGLEKFKTAIDKLENNLKLSIENDYSLV